MAVVGVSCHGWSTAPVSDKLPRDTAYSALDRNRAILAKFQTEQSSFSRGGIGMVAGWATLDGTTIGNDALHAKGLLTAWKIRNS